MIALPATKNLVDGKIDIDGTKTSTCFAYVSISTKTVPFSNLGAFPPSKATPIFFSLHFPPGAHFAVVEGEVDVLRAKAFLFSHCFRIFSGEIVQALSN